MDYQVRITTDYEVSIETYSTLEEASARYQEVLGDGPSDFEEISLFRRFKKTNELELISKVSA
jgi:hypothetical protein